MLTTSGILIGSILLLIALYSFMDGYNFTRTATSTTASVIDIISEIDNDGNLQYIPIFKFTTNNGDTYTFKGMDTCDHYWQIGEETVVVYDPHSPTRAKIASLTGTYGTAVILLFCASPFLIYTCLHVLNLA
ncbi:DUF3592 domain-containing protein [Chitinophaga sp. Cy-1792]|uniref:DUF3592 domain-containing protein n=1 Tax=Chitinophaga sp. Cy-1792 TaxID=2608339 RepID=UPI001423107B|nr:DUF3592 domain-containing protein [Chitinophaga sp. Cy-1792]NIG55483.1 DUF3592 domain-containing protein [Chitinophaga sp. Cy-1792]